jgi:hypothetical protein
MAKVVTIPMIENYTNYGFGEAGKMYHSADTFGQGVVFKYAGRCQNTGATFSLSFYDANCVGRDETGGPVAQGPRGYLSAQAVMIASTPVKRPRVVATLEVGDYVVLEGLDTILRVRAPKLLHDPDLEVITTPEPTVDYSDLVAAENAKPKREVSEAWLSG